ncbi:EFR1 family ferrodoxin [Anaeromicropila populeti]|uniref:4Fe-4S dicluster domain-containing protein n=1 Tax=Anaeromicropila populeti TaxID=37658 RepID=A0A1I6HNC1_9FIRM|nr:EFR1 family ferrodoxin [Anaeromicropila populeti]SFR55969.1 4Fe-4S dicluster domain-containing protein [Anaeromicropila populeti]
MKNLILYFSGTGNTKYTAERIADVLQDMKEDTELHSIEENFIPNLDHFDRLILGCPKYYEYPAFHFIKYLKKMLPVSPKPVPVFFFCTQTSPLNTDFRKIEKMLKKKNYQLITSKSFVIANNFTVFDSFPETTPEKKANNLSNLEKDLPLILTDFIQEKPSKESQSFLMHMLCWLSGIVFTRLFALFAVKFSPSNACTGCGLCARKCPKNNISMINNKPVFHKKCTFCMRCFSMCPAHSILYKGKERPQYCAPKRK